MEVLQHFRVIYGLMRQHFRDVEERCGLPGSHMWLLQEVQLSPGIGVGEIATRMGVHQSTGSQLVEKLVAQGYLSKSRQYADHRRVGLQLSEKASEALKALVGPAEGVLPEALATIPDVVLKTLDINLSELIREMGCNREELARTPLAEIVFDPAVDVRACT